MTAVGGPVHRISGRQSHAAGLPAERPEMFPAALPDEAEPFSLVKPGAAVRGIAAAPSAAEPGAGHRAPEPLLVASVRPEPRRAPAVAVSPNAAAAAAAATASRRAAAAATATTAAAT